MEPPKRSLNANLARISFRDAIAKLPPGSSPLILGHFDADGLAAVAILARALQRHGWTCAWPRALSST
jgi:single-stranded DNA-specific DHH superfamily exonuclease